MALTKVIGDGLGGTNDLTVDTTTLTVDASNNRVGVGNDTPLAVLDVKGSTDSFAGMAKVYLTDVTTNSDSRNWSIGNGGSAYGNLTISKSKVKDGNPSDSGTADNTLIINNAGHVTMPLQPAFHVQPSSLQANIAINTNVIVVYDSETYDVGSNFASNTFTAPVTGKYLLCYSLYLQALDTASNYYEAYINSSNRDYFASTIDPDFGDADWNYFSLTGSSIVDMDANDTAKIVIRQAGGTAQSDINTPSFFSGALIC